jgi:hypothetical protein
MTGGEWLLEVVLILLLGATLFHALRLERALGVLKRDRAVLEGLVEGFNESTRQAENGIDRLRSAAEGAGRQMARQIESAQRLRDDLSFLADRSDKLAERLEAAVRSARVLGDAGMLANGAASLPAPIKPLQLAVQPIVANARQDQHFSRPHFGPAVDDTEDEEEELQPRLRSQAERDLLRALRGAR